MDISSTIRQHPTVLACTLTTALFAVVFLVFSRGIGAGYLFDDFTSVAPLRVVAERPDLFWYFVFGDVSGPFGRPVSILSFALEHAYLGGDPDRSQIFSIAVHGINTGLVFALLVQIFRLTGFGTSVLVPAVALALLWAVAPQKISSALYIVQRMTLLAATFTLLAMNCYLRMRLESLASARWFYGVCCILALGLAPLAKENGILALAFIALVEVFVRPGAAAVPEQRLWRLLSLGILIAGTVGFVALGIHEFERAGESYLERNFSFDERVLSTPLVLVDYARQFILPVTTRMGLLHDDFALVGHGPGMVYVGLCALVVVLALVKIGASLIRGERSLLALGLGLFLVGHSLESTFLPLEVYFEHRNYLPSLGLVICLAALAGRLSTWAGARRQVLLQVVIGCYLFVQVFLAAMLASEWQSKERLFTHHMLGHPRSARANTDFALLLASRGNYEQALGLSERAFQFSRTEASADALGKLDFALLQAQIACLAGRENAFQYPPPGAVIESDPLRGSVVQTLERAHQDGRCSAAYWDTLSEWLWQVVGELQGQEISIRADALRDFSNLEFGLGGHLRSYIYASMASSQEPDNGTLLMMKVRAAVELQDALSIEEAIMEMRRLNAAGRLTPAETLFLESFGLGE